MIKKPNRLTVCILSVVLVGSLLVGCGTNGTADQTTAEVTVSANGKSSEATQGAESKEEPVELSFLKGYAEIDDDSELTKLIEERFNIDLKWFEVSSKNSQENLNVKLAGGEMPDVMLITSSQLANYVEGGVIGELPIELIREKAPNFAKCADENDDGSLWSTLIYKGKNYGIANPMSVKPFAMFWNQNWLDKLGLEVPVTLEDYETVLTAFVEQDPDGNGKRDTAGMAERSFGAVFGAFGLRCVTGGSPGFRVEEMQLGEDNVPFFPYIRPEAKQALEVLNRWYEKGIIDKEFVTGENHGGYNWLSHLFMNQRIGLTSAMLTHYFLYSTDMDAEDNAGTCLKEFKALNPEAKIVTGLGPVGPEGKSGTEAWGKVGSLSCLTTKAISDPRKVDAFLAILDAYYADEDYMELSNYGIEGKHFKKTEHGRVRLLDPAERSKAGVGVADFGDTVLYAEKMNPEMTEFVKQTTGNGYNRFSAPTTKEFSNAIATLKTLTEQAYFDIIIGEKPLDYFDTFVEEFKAAGGEAAEKSVQAAYAEQLAASGK